MVISFFFLFFVAIMILLLKKKKEVFNFYSFQNKILMPHIFSLFQETEDRVLLKIVVWLELSWNEVEGGQTGR